MYTNEHAALNVKNGMVGKPWRPSNGFEGEIFTGCVCASCKKCPADEPGCDIALNTLIYDIGDAEYPKEWVYGDDGRPQCEA